jgi:protein ImuB
MFACLHVTTPLTGAAGTSVVLDRVSAVAADMTPRWERVTPGDVLLDVSGLRRMCGGPDGIADAVRRLAADRGLLVRVVTAEAWSVALLRAAWPMQSQGQSQGQSEGHVPAGDEAHALHALPLEALGLLAGVGGPAGDHTHGRTREACATLQRWGIRTCGALAALPAADLHARLGAQGTWLQQRARGIDPRPLRSQPPDECFEETLALEWPIDGLEPLSFVLPRVLDPLCARLEARDRAAVVVRLVLRLTDRQQHVRAIELPAPVRDVRVLRTLLLLDLEAHPPHAGIDAITVAVDPAPGRITQYALLRKALPADDARVALLARLTALMGEGRCGAPALVDSHRPGAVAMQPFHPEAASATDVSPLATVATLEAGRARMPAREPATEGWLDTAGYHVRRLRRPWLVEVRTTAGARPLAVRIGAHGWSEGAVVQAAGPWRSSGAWWQGDPHAAWDRDEWDVALADGATYRLFHDRQTHQWWLDGEID